MNRGTGGKSEEGRLAMKVTFLVVALAATVA
jgi:hypothetical protein